MSYTLRDMAGVGPKREKLLNKLGIFAPRDLIYYFPRAYEDRSAFARIRDVEAGQSVSVSATLARDFTHARLPGRRIMSRAEAFDDTGRMTIVYFNQKYAAEKLKQGGQYIFYGKVTGEAHKKSMINPTAEPLTSFDPEKRILPVYPLCEGLTENYMRTLVREALETLLNTIEDPLSAEAEKEGLMALSDALYAIHFPKDAAVQETARKRLIFDELFYLMLGMSLLKNRRREHNAVKLRGDIDMKPFYDSLSFSPTNAQMRAIAECEADLTGDVPMNRLIQGDVGCGKTTVAEALIYRCARSGAQTAFMAPTEVLARQHYENMSALFAQHGINTVLLTGSLTARERRMAYERIETGFAQVVVGTHALITEGVRFSHLALTITDEQHRFGVRQRASLIGKGDGVHTLVMSATPIPRTLGLIMYGDLDISIIDELPAGRMKIDTFLVDGTYKARIYAFVKKQVAMGHRVYIICPAVEYDEESTMTSVTELYEELKGGALSDISLGVLYGKMKAEQKQKVMEDFSSGEIEALIATTVVEVGVDVKNASLIVIEDADRFGLSQLHQLRGRVGRSDIKSYCVLISDSKNELTLERLKTLTKTNDGFEIAEADLKLRGPGDFLGSRQHGLPYLRLAELTDMDMITLAKSRAQTLLDGDPDITRKENAPILKKIEAMFFDDAKKNIFN
ncbi:MAG: ATP-dependent DNA helicase RecG [Clostridia bacterium]|nr:ATP-dependent DNA helicase RecG [Clostridia bacterium]